MHFYVTIFGALYLDIDRGDMERSGDERAANTSQPCRKSQNRARMLALEEAYGEYELKPIKNRGRQ